MFLELLAPFGSESHFPPLASVRQHSPGFSLLFCHFSVFYPTSKCYSQSWVTCSLLRSVKFSPQIVCQDRKLPWSFSFIPWLQLLSLQIAHTLISSLISPLSFILVWSLLEGWKSLQANMSWNEIKISLAIPHTLNPLPLFSESVNGTMIHPIIKVRKLYRNLFLYLPYSVHHCILLILPPK